MPISVIELAEQIKEKGQRSTAELPELLKRAQLLACDPGQDLRTRALAHRAAGNAHQLMNQFQLALQHYNEAAVMFDSLDDRLELGRTLHAKVGMLFSLSRFDELFKCSEQARRLFEEASDNKRLARLDVNLAHAYHRLGQPRQALECSERAIPVLEQIHDSEGLIAAAINSAVTLTAMHEFERAEQRYRLAMNLASEMKMVSWILLSRYNLAYLRYLAGDTAAALEELLRLKQEYIDLKDDWMTCQCWLDESEIFLEIGNIEDSISAALAARKLASKLALNSEIAKSLLYEAVCLMQLGKAADAQKLLDEATTRFASEGDQTSTAVSKLQACLFRAENGDEAALLDAIDARDRLKDVGLPHRLALADIVVGRIQRAAGEFDRAIKSFRSALNSAAQSRSLWMQFHASCELGLSLDRLNDAEAHELFRQADGMLDSLWDRLGSDELKMTFLADRENVYTHLVRSAVMESPSAGFEYAEKARSRVLSERLLGGSAQRTASHLRSRLSADESIVEYFVSGDDLYIFVLRKDELLSVDCHGIVRHVKSEWKNLERHLQSCSVKWEHLSSVRPHLQTTARHHLRNLYDDLVAPVEHALAPVVIFAPHGFLHDIPMQALFDGSRYLAERCDVGYTPSASLYCNPAAKQQFDKPLFIAFSTSPDSSSVEEVQQAASLAGPSDLLVNPSIEVLRHAFRVPREIVHIAGHARVDAINGTISSIETADGPLTNRDLLDMQVRAKTLVITGCQTARRAIQPGDEWLGLMRSFYLSGASTIVSALWDIRDEAARRFAGEFYRQFDGGNALPAVRNAAAEIRHWKGHPYFWSGFGVFVRRI